MTTGNTSGISHQSGSREVQKAKQSNKLKKNDSIPLPTPLLRSEGVV
jgi:hypothetical protein